MLVLSKLLRKSQREIKELLGNLPIKQIIRRRRQRVLSGDTKSIDLPSDSHLLQEKHLTYLRDRNFDPVQLVADYGISGTGSLGDCKHRIVIPIIRQGRRISYTARDITGKSKARYKNCPAEKESFPAKSWLYDLDRCVDAERVLVVEGPTDAWRIGKGCVATMGIKWTWAQAELLSRFQTVFILFDPEDQAQEQAAKLVDTLKMQFVETEIVPCPAEDPGSMTELEVKKLRRWLGLR